MGGAPSVPEPPSPAETSRANYQQQVKFMPQLIAKDFQGRMKWEPRYAANWLQNALDYDGVKGQRGLLDDYLDVSGAYQEGMLDQQRGLLPEQTQYQNALLRQQRRLLPQQTQTAIAQGRADLKVAGRLAPQQIRLASRLLPKQVQYDEKFARKYQGLNVINTQNQLTLEKRFGDDFAKAYRNKLQAMDPKAFALREQAVAKANADLAAGTSLTDDEAREVEQAVRAGQTARGGGRGNAAIFEEAMTRGSRGRELYQNRLANAANLSSNVVADQSQITRPTAYQHAPTASAPSFQNMFAGGGMGGGGGGGFQPMNFGSVPNFAAMGPSGGGMQYYSPVQGMSAQENFANRLAYSQANNRPNPYLKGGISMATGAATGALSGAMMGSVVPGIGTAVGAIGGGLAGMLGGVGGFF